MSLFVTVAGCGYNPVCHIVSAGTGAVSDVAGSAVDALAEAITDAVGDTIKSVATLWTRVGTPALGDPATGRPSDTVGFLQGSLTPYLTAAAVVSVLVAGGRMAMEQNARPGRELFKSLMTLVLASGAGVAAVTLATQEADAFSDWIIGQSTDETNFGKNLSAMLVGGATPAGAPAAILVILLGLLSIVTCLLQVALMVMRGGMLVVLAGILPLAASFTNTEIGRQWFQKAIAWLIAFILYKPAAAIVYATAFRLTGTDVFASGGLQTYVTGLVLMTMAILTLPALLRFCIPAVSSLASGNGGTSGLLAGGAAIAASTMGGVPSGAIAVGAASGGHSGVAGGGEGPSGAGPSTPGSGGPRPGGGGTPGPDGPPPDEGSPPEEAGPSPAPVSSSGVSSGSSAGDTHVAAPSARAAGAPVSDAHGPRAEAPRGPSTAGATRTSAASSGAASSTPRAAWGRPPAPTTEGSRSTGGARPPRMRPTHSPATSSAAGEQLAIPVSEGPSGSSASRATAEEAVRVDD